MRALLMAMAIGLLALFFAPSSVPAQSDQPFNCAAFSSWEWAQTAYELEHGPGAVTPPGGVCPSLPHGAAPALWTDAVPEAVQAATVVNVIDGDTIDVQLLDGTGAGTVERLRLILIDTPETKDPSKPVQCFGAEATAFTTWLLGQADGGTLYLERDVSDRDRYDRLLRYVWLEIDGHPYLANEALGRSGFGTLSTYPPDVKYVDLIGDAQTFARDHRLGLWDTCGGPGMPVATAPPVYPSSLSPTPDATPFVSPLHLVSLVSPTAEGGTASIEVVAWPGANCSITVRYADRPSRSEGLDAARADAGGRVAWSWSVGSNEISRAWSIAVMCDSETLDIAIRAT